MTERTERILAAIENNRMARGALEARLAAFAPVIESVSGMSALTWAALVKVLPDGWADALGAFRKGAEV